MGDELEIFRKKRRQERAYRREFQELLSRKEAGEAVDEHRLECLALFARHFVGDSLSPAETATLEEFYRMEEEKPKSASEKPTTEPKNESKLEDSPAQDPAPPSRCVRAGSRH